MAISLNLAEKLNTELVLTSLRQAEGAREFGAMIRLFKPLWNIDEKPDFSAQDISSAAALYELAGKFLIEYGRARNLANWQERGKDTLENAIAYYELTGCEAKVFECRMMIGIAYLYEGRIQEYQILLENAEGFFAEDKTHPVYLQIQINYSLYQSKIGNPIAARQIIENLAELVEAAQDVKIKVLFYTQAGIVCRTATAPQKSLDYFAKALHFAKKIENIHYQALITNCIANTYRLSGKFDSALMMIRQALKTLAEDSGWRAHLLDTKANIYLDKGDFDTALDWSMRAAELFASGDDLAGYADALWTQIEIYLKLDLREIALARFIELHALAENSGGARLASKYTRKYLAKNLPNPETGSFEEKVVIYKRSLIADALQKTGGRVTESARLLGFKNHQTLSTIIKKQFPELLADYSISRKLRSDRRFASDELNK